MISRRTVIQALGTSALPMPLAVARPAESANAGALPKICLDIASIDDAAMRRIRQLGVEYVLMGGPRIPWDEAEVKSRIERLKAGGLTLCNMMIGGFPKTLLGQPGRDEEIEKVLASIRVAGRVGLPVVEYNFYAHRAVEGYYEEIGRAGLA